MTRAYRVVVLLLLLALAGCGQKEKGTPAVPMQIGSKAKGKAGGTSLTTAEKREERTPEQLCQKFAALKNAGDPKANELLGRAPKVPDQPVSPVEAEALQTDYYLHDKIRIVSVDPVVNRPQRFTLKTTGGMITPRIPVIGEGAYTRNMGDMTVVVEVRDGKIFGVRSEL
jgi:hypothetical protein